MRARRRARGLPLLASIILPVVSVPPDVTRAVAPVNPIRHIVVLMQENRSFDHYFGVLHDQGQPELERIPRNASNPNPRKPGEVIRAFHKHRTCEVHDLNHGWNGLHRQYNHGRMNGFTRTNMNNDENPTGSRAMGYYTREELPFYYALLSRFGTSDRYFSSVMAPTYPNRFFLFAGTSFGHIRNDHPGPRGFRHRTIFNMLGKRHITWRVYYSTKPSFAAKEFVYVRKRRARHVFPISRYFKDAAAGKLPAVSFLEPKWKGYANTETDEHPPVNVQVGERFARHTIMALMHGPNWPSSAYFLTYDEAGGFYDHVPPPKAPVPDAIPPKLHPGDVKAGFGRYGLRVPLAVVSPWSRPHFVSHHVFDHTSILRFIEKRFGLPALTRRDRAARPMLGFFDFTHPSFLVPPTLPRAVIDQEQAQICSKLPYHAFD